MSTITYNTNDTFPFHKLSLANPHGIQGGAYFSKIKINENEPFLFQTPKCSTKNGIVSTDKKIYCDLILDHDNETFINFLQELERNVQQLIYEKRDLWFHNNMEMENIEYFFNPIIRTYKKHFLVRTYIQQPKHIKRTKSLQIYDANENRLTIKDVTKKNKIIAIVEGLGIKFTSSSFHLELCLRQVMILENKPIFHKCLIQLPHPSRAPKDPMTEHLNHKITSTENENGEEDAPKSEENVGGTTIVVAAAAEGGAAEVAAAADAEAAPDAEEAAPDAEEAAPDAEEAAPAAPEPEEEAMEDMTAPLIKLDNSINATTAPKVESSVVPQKEEQGDISNNKDIDLQTENAGENTENTESLEQTAPLCEIKVDIPKEKGSVHLKDPIVVYREIYKKAMVKAKEARRLAIRAFLEAKQIKNTFLVGEVEDSEDDDLDTFKEF